MHDGNMQKGKTHNQAVNKLLADTEIIKVAADKRELIKGAKKKKVRCLPSAGLRQTT